MVKDLFKEIFWSLSGNRIRSGLTILGIVIGIASVITMVSIGQGAKNSIESNIEAIGSNLIMVMPGAQRSGGFSSGRGSAQTLTLEDFEAVQEEATHVSAVSPEVTQRYQLTAKGTNTNTSVTGTTIDYLAVHNVNMDSGTFITDRNVQVSSKVAVLGPTTRDDLFGVDSNPIGQSIRINSINFTVIGITQEKGGTGFSNSDDVVYIPISTAQHFLSGNEYVNTLSISAQSQEVMPQAQEEVQNILMKQHKIADSSLADFTILNQNDIIATATSVTGTFTILLASIAGISLLVGGIGIMNMMLTTVTERTREIGLRKAMGIKKFYINMQFLGEAVTLTFLGGGIGVLLGWLASIGISYFAGLTTEISFTAIVVAFGVSAVVGIVFGFYPARRAAGLSPIEALRYE